MAGEHLNVRTRRVISGLDAEGKSTFVSDEDTPTRIATPAFTVNDVWRVESLPISVDAMHTLGDEVELAPPLAGLVFRVATFPPDSEVDRSEYDDAINLVHGEDSNAHDEHVMGMHVTDTHDIAIITEGEIYAVLETGEKLLRKGDCMVYRGVNHAWSNRTDKPVTMVAIQIPATR